MLPSQRHRSGNEAKSAFGKILARTHITLKLGAILALTTAVLLISLVYLTRVRQNPIDSIIDHDALEHLEVEAIPARVQESGATHRDKLSKNDRLRRNDDGRPPVADVRKANYVSKAVAGFAKNKKALNLRPPPSEPGIKQKAHPDRIQRANEPLLTSDQHIYTSADIPYFDEDVPSFKARVSDLLTIAKKDSIFVSLGSFRDDLCPATLLELFEKAKDPRKIIVGLVDQVKLTADSDDVACDSSLPLKYRGQVRLVRLTSLEGRGPTHARYIASKLYQGEQFYVQIDSHSHFKQNWDLLIRQQLMRLPNPARSVITHYPPGDVSELDDSNPPWICSNRQHKDAPPGLLVQESDWCYPENRSPGVAVAPDGSLTTCVSPFMGGGFIVGPGSWVVDVPYDKYIPYIFHGEELLIASRLWTSGWDMFTPSENILDHKYGGREKNVYAETNTWSQVGELSTARARHILGTALPGDVEIPFDKSELEYLGMGSERSYADYLEFAGINLKGNSTGRCGQRYNWDQKRWEGKIKLMTG